VDKDNAVWAGPVSALRWVPLAAYAADGKPATYSKGKRCNGTGGLYGGYVGILYGPVITVDAFRFLYRKPGVLVTSIAS